ncbi:MAG TPA: hypothetical protein VE172_12365 [Stackebrandtia sp.]|uniref:hypothetical protein n=1 Tax=Stackebrandtia sp. TaxID=2023065 RepID=UPI002D57D3A3|nr:hypothetical protein [Stackebrandtia sp.]HZE39595.1 hypothetical protein [Stackebrandtia sp.]
MDAFGRGGNQIDMAKAMRNLLAANSGLLKWGRKDIDGIAHDGLKTVQSFGKSSNGDSDLATFWTGALAGGATQDNVISTVEN